MTGPVETYRQYGERDPYISLMFAVVKRNCGGERERVYGETR